MKNLDWSVIIEMVWIIFFWKEELFIQYQSMRWYDHWTYFNNPLETLSTVDCSLYCLATWEELDHCDISRNEGRKRERLLITVGVDWSLWNLTAWTSCQIRKIASCTCAGNAGNVFPTTDFKGDRKLATPACIEARAVMHVGIANPRLRGKRPRHSRRMRHSQLCVSGKRPMKGRKKVDWSLWCFTKED